MPAARPTKPRKKAAPAVADPGPSEQDRAIVEAVERDQRRVAQALHDTICQSLTGIHLLARVTERRFANECPSAVAEVMKLGDELNQAVEEVRDLVRLLVPAEIETGRLRFALRALASDLSARVPCEVECQEPLDPIESSIATQLYAIAQVAVDRALQLHGITRICIGLREEGGAIELTVRARGEDLETAPVAAPRRLLGWELMEHRSRAIGGTLSTEFPNGTGTIASCRVPSAVARRAVSRSR